MLKAKTLKNLALTLGEEKPVNDSLSFKKYYIPVNAEQHDKWIMECAKLETAGMLKPDEINNVNGPLVSYWRGSLHTKYERLSLTVFQDEVVIAYKTKSALDKM
jgi:hypothetical protein